MSSDPGTIDFSCACGLQVRARVDQGGRLYSCTSCGRKIQVPRVAISSHASLDDRTKAASGPMKKAFWESILRIPSSFGELLAYLLASWAIVCVVTLVLSFFAWYIKIAALLVFLCTTVAVAEQIWRLLRARQRVLVDKDVPLLWGMVRLIAWDPVEGVLFLQNKRLSFSDDNLYDGHGGIRFIYPVFGDELAVRVPLEVQTLRFSDENVMTREYLSVTIRGTMKWRIVDIKKFYLLVSRVLRTSEDRGIRTGVSAVARTSEETNINGLVNAAIEWLRLLAEEQTRMVVSRISSGLLIADRLSSELPEIGLSGSNAAQAASTEWRSAADGLSSTISDSIAPRVAEYGIAIDDVALQELKLPEEIIKQCIEACKAAYLPILAQRKASAKRAELEAEVELLGRETIGAREIVGAAPAFGLVDFVSQFLNKQLAATTGLVGAPSAALLASAPKASAPPSLPTTK